MRMLKLKIVKRCFVLRIIDYFFFYSLSVNIHMFELIYVVVVVVCLAPSHVFTSINISSFCIFSVCLFVWVLVKVKLAFRLSHHFNSCSILF